MCDNPENVEGYLIRITYADDTQEIISRPYGDMESIEIDVDIDLEQNPTLNIEIAAYNSNGWQSCWSVYEEVVVDVPDYTLAGFEDENDVLSIFPNPINDKSNIRFKVLNRTDLEISVYDLLGNEIKTLTSGYYEAGIYDVTLKINDLASGAYYIRYRFNDRTVSKLFIVNQ